VQREITLAAKMHHSNVIKVFGACIIQSTNEVWLVMEYGEEGSLYFYLEDTTKVKSTYSRKDTRSFFNLFFSYTKKFEQEISWNLRWRWATEAASAVAHLHQQGVIHRDIKSPNFVISKGSLKICDFGTSTISVLSPVLSTVSGRPKVQPITQSSMLYPLSTKINIGIGWYHTLGCS
jgi:serine/threonine protein kinase